jgi:hypothetical protein
MGVQLLSGWNVSSDPKAQRCLLSDDGLTAVLSPYPPVSKLIVFITFCYLDYVKAFVTLPYTQRIVFDTAYRLIHHN